MGSLRSNLEDAWILYMTARLPERLRMGKFADHLDEAYGDRFSDGRNRSLFAALIGRTAPADIDPGTQRSLRELLRSVNLEQARRNVLKKQRRERRRVAAKLFQQGH